MASLAGSIELLVGPSTKGFWKKAEGELRRGVPKVDIRINPDTARASAELAAWRKRQEANRLNLRIDVDGSSLKKFEKDFKRVEHIFTQSPLKKAIRVNVAVVGAASLPALAQGALSAAAALTELGQAALVLPGILGGLVATVGTVLVGLRGLGDAFKAAGDGAKKSAANVDDYHKATRDVARAQRDLQKAVKDVSRSIEDQGAAMRDTYLDKAQAAIDVERARQEMMKKSGKSLLDQREDQVKYLKSLSDQARVTRESTRTIQDGTQAFQEGVKGSDDYLSATDRLSTALDAFTKAQNNANGMSEKFQEAMAGLGPAAQDFVNKVLSIKGAWDDLSRSVSNSLLAGVGDSIVDLANKRLPQLKDAMTGVARELNTTFKSLLGNLGSDQNASFLSKIFSNTAAAIRLATPGLNSFINGFLQLAEVGSRFLPRLGAAFTGLGDKFAAFIDRADKDGSLERWINKGLTLIDSLASGIGSIGSILNSVTEAYEKATGNVGGLATTLAGSLKKLADYLGSAGGQAALVGYINKARGFIDTIRDSVPDILRMFTVAGEAMRTFGSIAFPVFAAISRFITDHIGLAKLFFGLYLAKRTFAPVYDGLRRISSFYEKFHAKRAAQTLELKTLEESLNKTKADGLALINKTREAAALANVQAQDNVRVAQEAAGKSKLIEQDRVAAHKLALRDLVTVQAAETDLRERALKAEEKFQKRAAKVLADPTTKRDENGKFRSDQERVGSDRYAAQYYRDLKTREEEVAGAMATRTQAMERQQTAWSQMNQQTRESVVKTREYKDAQAELARTVKQSDESIVSAHKSVDTETSRLSRSIEYLEGNALKKLKMRIGDAGGVKAVMGDMIGTMGRVVGAIGTAGAGIGLGFALEYLYNQHQKAADAAQHQTDMLRGLQTQLDQTNGSVSQAGVATFLKGAQEYKVRGEDNNFVTANAVADSIKFGVSAQQLGLSTDPQQTAVRDDTQTKYQAATLAAIRAGKDRQWNEKGAMMRAAGIDDVTYAMAVQGDPDAVKKFEGALDAMKRQVPGSFGGTIVPAGAVPDLGTGASNLLGSAPIAPAQALNTAIQGNVQGSTNIQQLGTSVSFKPAGAALFPGAEKLTLNAARDGVSFDMNNLSPDQVEYLRQQTGATPVQRPGTNSYTWNLSGDALRKYVQGFKHGGPVGGKGSGDRVPAMLEPGEHVLTKGDVSAMGGQSGVSAFRQGLALGGVAGVPIKRPPPIAPPPIRPPAPAPGIPSILNAPGRFAGAGPTILGGGPGASGNPRIPGVGASTGAGGWFASTPYSAPPLVSPFLSPSTIARTHGEGADIARDVSGAGAFRKSFNFPPLAPPPPPPSKLGTVNGAKVNTTPGKGNLIAGYHWEGDQVVKDGGATHGSGGSPGQSQVHTGGGAPIGPSPHTGTGVPQLPGPVTVPTPSGPITASVAVTPGGQVTVNTSGSGALADNGTTARSAVSNAPIIPNANIIDYLSSVATANGLRVGSSSRPEETGSQHSVNRAVDIGNLDQANSGQISAFVNQWMSDPTKVAATRQLIFRGPDGDYGIINGRRLEGQELQSVFGDDLGGHKDHVHLALEGVPGDAVGPDGQPLGIPGGGGVTVAPDGSGISPFPGAPFAPIGPGAGALEAGQQGGFGFDFGNGDINGPFGKVPFNPIDFSKQLGGIFLQMIGGFFGLDLSQIAGPLGSILGGGSDSAKENAATDPDALAAADQGIEGYDSGELPQGAAFSGQLPQLGSNPTQADVAKYIIGKGKSLGYNDQQIQAILSTGLQESGLNEDAKGGRGAWHGIFQQDSGYPGRDVASSNIDAFFDRLGSKGGKSGDIWKNIFWLQQAPGMASADQAFSSGRKNYLTEIQSQAGRAQGLMASLGMADGGRVFGSGGSKQDMVPASLSPGEFVMNANSARKIGYDKLHQANSMHFDGGGFVPFLPPVIPALSNPGTAPAAQMPQSSPTAAPPSSTGQPAPGPGMTNGIAPPPPVMPMGPMAGPAGGAPDPNAGPAAALGNLGVPNGGPVGAGPAPMASSDPTVPGGGGEGGIKADPNAANSDTQQAVEGVLGGLSLPSGGTQPGGGGDTGPGGNDEKDPRATIGAQPASTQHLNPGLKAGIEGAFQQAGAIGAMAASAAASGATMGAGGAAGGAAGSLIQSGAQIAGQVASGAANVLSSLAVGNITGGTTGQGYGAPLLPQQAPQTPVRSFQNVHNGDVNVRNEDQYTAAQKRMQAQQAGSFMNRVPI